ncbi:unnamed protein product [Paramecium primaurelia]|uniref:Uncharacterized protein n=1 Tax=Paramecium primaurelia TaxID=5886 RepID=A0A8S1QNM0_PARPR|nr:unnamed protein product [Paramecium primaurelia]
MNQNQNLVSIKLIISCPPDYECKSISSRKWNHTQQQKPQYITQKGDQSIQCEEVKKNSQIYQFKSATQLWVVLVIGFQSQDIAFEMHDTFFRVFTLRNFQEIVCMCQFLNISINIWHYLTLKQKYFHYEILSNYSNQIQSKLIIKNPNLLSLKYSSLLFT